MNHDDLTGTQIKRSRSPSDPTPLPQRQIDDDSARSVPGGAVRPRRHDRRYRARPRRRGQQDAPRPRSRNAAARNTAAVRVGWARAGCSAARSKSGRSITTSPSMRDEFLANYEADLCIETTLFPGIDELLDQLDARGVRWGIVTNKITRLSEPLVALLGLDTRAACLVCGDTTPHSKPHPAPLLHAARTARRRAGAHRLCRRRPARRAGGFRGRHDHRRGGLRLLRRRHSADAAGTRITWCDSPVELQHLLRDIG